MTTATIPLRSVQPHKRMAVFYIGNDLSYDSRRLTILHPPLVRLSSQSPVPSPQSPVPSPVPSVPCPQPSSARDRPSSHAGSALRDPVAPQATDLHTRRSVDTDARHWREHGDL